MRTFARAAIRCFVPATFAVAVIVLWAFGFGEHGVREALRGTARISLVLFCLAFVARPLHELAGSRVSAFLLHERRAIGVCFGLSFSAHLLLIVTLFVLNGELGLPDGVTVLDVAIGGPGILLVFLMTLTSAWRIRRALSPALWQRLHTVGIHFVWFVFTACLLNSITAKAHLYPSHHYLPFLALLGAALGIRVAAALRARHPKAPVNEGAQA